MRQPHPRSSRSRLLPDHDDPRLPLEQRAGQSRRDDALRSSHGPFMVPGGWSPALAQARPTSTGPLSPRCATSRNLHGRRFESGNLVTGCRVRRCWASARSRARSRLRRRANPAPTWSVVSAKTLPPMIGISVRQARFVSQRARRAHLDHDQCRADLDPTPVWHPLQPECKYVSYEQ